MRWTKKGLVYKPSLSQDWGISHAQVPFGYPIDEFTIRVYFATRDRNNRSVTTFIEVDSTDLKEIKYIHNAYCLGLGEKGTHDDNGAMPSCFVKVKERIFLYYTGWNIGSSVSYRTAVGLAISKDGGLTFERYSKGPILDRSIYDPCFVCQPFVLRDGGIWRMWYLSCTKWEIVNNLAEPFYHVKYAESDDGINWRRTGEVSLDYAVNIDAIGNPTVIKEFGIYKMYFSYRKANNYRTDPNSSYKIGYAESANGVHFVLKNEEIILVGDTEDWESIMNAYPHVFDCNGKRYMLYNGDGFGKSGFGYAVANIS
jgi:hypothetical protein